MVNKSSSQRLWLRQVQIKSELKIYQDEWDAIPQLPTRFDYLEFKKWIQKVKRVATRYLAIIPENMIRSQVVSKLNSHYISRIPCIYQSSVRDILLSLEITSEIRCFRKKLSRLLRRKARLFNPGPGLKYLQDLTRNLVVDVTLVF